MPYIKKHTHSIGGVATHRSIFGMTTGLVFFLDDVNCTGNESSIFDCQHPPSTDCQVFRREEAGVICGVTPGKVTFNT